MVISEDFPSDIRAEEELAAGWGLGVAVEGGCPLEFSQLFP